MRDLVLPITAGSGMHFEWIGGVKIYRPRPQSDSAIRRKAESSLREKFEPGIYNEVSQTQAILHRQVDFFGSRFDELITSLASRSFLEFVLWQYDQCGIVENRRKQGELSGEALRRWTNVNHLYPRALKYIAERITMIGPEEVADSRKPSIDEIDEVIICAEELVGYCITSDLTRLFPEKTQIVVQTKGQPTYCDHTVIDSGMEDFQSRIYKDTAIRDTLFDGVSYDLDHKAHAKYLDEPLFKTIGIRYSEALSILSKLRNGCTAAPGDPYQTKFVLLDGVVEKVAQIFDKPKDAVARLLSGFWLTKEALGARARVNEDLWKPANKSRAYRRALFVMPHSLGPHLAFSNQMFDEALVIMAGDVSFGSFPKEWLSPDVESALGKLVTIRGHWFEKQVQKNLQTIGIDGLIGKRSLGKGKYSIELPGEFDFIGWSQEDKALVLLEAKMMQAASEPGLWKNQCDSFTQIKDGEENFVQKLKRKSSWLANNAGLVSDALRAEGIATECDPNKILSGFITYAPIAASYFVQEFPCVALSEFMSDYNQIKTWPYSTGKFTTINSAQI